MEWIECTRLTQIISKDWFRSIEQESKSTMKSIDWVLPNPVAVRLNR